MNSKRLLTPAISELARSLVKLHEILGFQAEKIQLKQPSKQALLLENIAFHDVAVCNVEMIRQVVDGLQKRLEDRELDTWSERQTFERQQAGLNEQLGKLQEICDLNKQLGQQVSILEETVAQCTTRLAEAEKQYAGEKEKQWIGFVREIIQIRDNLAMKEEILKEEENYQETKAWKLIQSLYRETEAILDRQGVIPVRQEGLFDGNIQRVTDIVPAHREELHNTVAKTFREGYKTKDQFIRLQEVVLFSYKP